jgi:hypothetical protein
VLCCGCCAVSVFEASVSTFVEAGVEMGVDPAGLIPFDMVFLLSPFYTIENVPECAADSPLRY